MVLVVAAAAAAAAEVDAAAVVVVAAAAAAVVEEGLGTGTPPGPLEPPRKLDMGGREDGAWWPRRVVGSF